MIAYGIDSGIKLQMLPIQTVGMPLLHRYKAWLFDQRRVEVLEAFEVPRPNGGAYIIPAGFQFDGGSIPRWLLVIAVIINSMLPPSLFTVAIMFLVLTGLLIERFGLMLYAFAVHDFAVRYGVLVLADGRRETIPNVRAANNVMRRVNFATNDMILIGWVAHLAVFLAAWRAWRSYREAEPLMDWLYYDYGVKLQTETTR